MGSIGTGKSKSVADLLGGKSEDASKSIRNMLINRT
jgi:hypothetical protein